MKNINKMTIRRQLTFFWLKSCRNYPVCLTVFKGIKIDLNAKNRLTFVQSEICKSYIKGKGIILPPIKKTKTTSLKLLFWQEVDLTIVE